MHLNHHTVRVVENLWDKQIAKQVTKRREPLNDPFWELGKDEWAINYKLWKKAGRLRRHCTQGTALSGNEFLGHNASSWNILYQETRI